MPKPAVFVSYRRKDLLVQGSIRAIWSELEKYLGDRLCTDLYSMHGGQNFHSVLVDRVRQADVVIVLIGPQWVSLMAELETAFEAQIPSLPEK